MFKPFKFVKKTVIVSVLTYFAVKILKEDKKRNNKNVLKNLDDENYSDKYIDIKTSKIKKDVSNINKTMDETSHDSAPDAKIESNKNSKINLSDVKSYEDFDFNK